jgi:hypothetical protein
LDDAPLSAHPKVECRSAQDAAHLSLELLDATGEWGLVCPNIPSLRPRFAFASLILDGRGREVRRVLIETSEPLRDQRPDKSVTAVDNRPKKKTILVRRA